MVAQIEVGVCRGAWVEHRVRGGGEVTVMIGINLCIANLAYGIYVYLSQPTNPYGGWSPVDAPQVQLTVHCKVLVYDSAGRN